MGVFFAFFFSCLRLQISSNEIVLCTLVHALAHTSNFYFSLSEYLSLSSECESYAMQSAVDLVFSSSFSTFIWIRVNVYLLIDVVGTSFSLSRSIYEVTAGWLVGMVRYGVRCTLLIATSPWLFARTPYTSITNWNTNFENLSFSTLRAKFIWRTKSEEENISSSSSSRSSCSNQQLCRNKVTIQASVPITVKHWFQHSILLLLCFCCFTSPSFVIHEWTVCKT